MGTNPVLTSVLQFEIDRQGLKRYSNASTVKISIQEIAEASMDDVLANGGTFVLVVSETKITIVQRPDAAEIEP